MKRSRHIWIGFLLCLAVVLAAMGWISLRALELDRARAEALDQEAQARGHEIEARRQAAWEEHVRLALWRMDSALSPLVAQESVRPYFAYKSFLPMNRAYGNMFNDRGGGEILIPSPLLSERSPNILVHFQFEPDGSLTSPQVPTGTNRKLAVPNHVSQDAVRELQERLARVHAVVDRQKLTDLLPKNAPGPVEMIVLPLAETAEQRLTRQNQRRLDLQQRGRSAVEFGQRYQAIQQNTNLLVQNWDRNQFNDLSLPSTDISGVSMRPLWIDGSLLLARRVSAGGKEYVQGCLLDWPAIKALLLGEVEDLLPEAGLEPVCSDAEVDEGRMLAALPVRLIPGRTPTIDFPAGGPAADVTAAGAGALLSPIVLSLGVAWGCVLLAAVAVAVLLLGVIRLSERRASFVTAVTHELRTPLTTFQMYAEMLAEGMVPDQTQQQSYLNTLRAESARLAHMVENVLSYARLQRGRGDGRLESVTLGQLLEPVTGRLAARAKQAGMELVIERDDELDEVTVRANTSAAEQVLFNLVDNACKYAAGAADRRIHLVVRPGGGVAELRLRDHGPGVSASARRQLFSPFSKTAHEAACTAPGVGLGLALSRRLARDMGGDLRLDEKVTGGACFVLTLPLAG